MGSSDAATIIGAVIGVGGVILAALLAVFFANRSDIKKRHDQNRLQWEEQKIMLRQHTPHSHKEETGPLMAENIMRWKETPDVR